MLTVDTHFNALISARNLEIEVRWQKVQIFFLINSALLGVVLGASFPDTLKIIGCLFGVAITTIWSLIQEEAQNAIDYWNQKIYLMESQEKETSIKAFGFIEPREGFKMKYTSTFYLILLLVGVFFLGWVSLLIYFLLS